MKQEKKYDIFISYRRDGGEVTARILRDTLTERGYTVFFDVESLRSGAFNTKLYSVIEECKDFILILSPNALDRCVNDDDWVRREIEYAIEKGKNVIPILLRNFTFPDNLPITLKDLPFQNGLAANLEYFDAFITKLESFFKTKKVFRTFLSDHLRKIKLLPILLAAVAILAASAFGLRWFQKYPRTAAQVNLTESVLANVSYNLTYLDILAGAHNDMLQATNDYLITEETDICISRLAVCSNSINNVDLSLAAPGTDLLENIQSSPFVAADLKAMYDSLVSFKEETQSTMAYMEYLISEECVLSDSEKMEIVQLYSDYLSETTQWFAYCTNEMLLPITNQRHLSNFWSETLPYLGNIPLNASNWSLDKEALVEAGNECYENCQQILSELRGILGDTTIALRNDQAQTRQQLIDAGYTEARAEKIVSYASKDWEADLMSTYLQQGYSDTEATELAREEAAKYQDELDMILAFSGLISDDMNTIWEKMTYLLKLGLYEEAEECAILYQLQMDNSDRYLPALILFLELIKDGQLDYGIMVMEYADENTNPQLMIGDIIYQFNGQPCKNYESYISMKQALTTDTYTVKLLRMDDNNQIQVLEITLTTDSPQVYLNDLVANPNA